MTLENVLSLKNAIRIIFFSYGFIRKLSIPGLLPKKNKNQILVDLGNASMHKG